MSVENKKTYLKGVSDKKNTCKIQVESEKKKEKEDAYHPPILLLHWNF